MTGDLSPIDTAKFVAASRACEFVEDGMRVGLGTGSTAAWLVRCLGERLDARRVEDLWCTDIHPHGRAGAKGVGST